MQSVGFLVPATLPRRVWIRKPHVDIQGVHQLWGARQLRASVIGQTSTREFGQLLHLATETLRWRFSCASVHPAKDHKRRLSFDRFPYAGAVESPLDQIAFPVARNQSLPHVLRAMQDTQLLRSPRPRGRRRTAQTPRRLAVQKCLPAPATMQSDAAGHETGTRQRGHRL